MIAKDKYKEDLLKYRWLEILIDVYNISDTLMSKYLKKYENNIVCKKGCSNCCKKPSIPLTQLEFMGISWFCSEHLRNPLRKYN